MGWIRLWAWAGLVCLFCMAGIQAQQDQPAAASTSASAVAAVPRLIKCSGTVTNVPGEPNARERPLIGAKENPQRVG